MVRYRDEAKRNRSRAFTRKADADRFNAEVTRRRQLGVLPTLITGGETLNDFVTQTWAPTHAVTVSAKTRQHYAGLYDHHLAPYLGDVALRELRPELIARWQADRLQAGGGPVAVAAALTLLGNILQRALEADRITTNPARLVRRARLPRRKEMQPLAPAVVERLRSASNQRDATLIAILAYGGLRPSEALALCWEDVRERTLLVQRSVSLGQEDDTKTTQHRTVRLLSPLKTDLAEWRLASGRPHGDALVFPSQTGALWSVAAYQSWRRRSFGSARVAVDNLKTTPYALRHSFASLLLHEGRSVIYVARQLGHDARLTLTRYGHVIDELETSPASTPRRPSDRPAFPRVFPLRSLRPPTAQPPPPTTRPETPLLPGILRAGWSQPGSNRRPPANQRPSALRSEPTAACRPKQHSSAGLGRPPPRVPEAHLKRAAAPSVGRGDSYPCN